MNGSDVTGILKNAEKNKYIICLLINVNGIIVRYLHALPPYDIHLVIYLLPEENVFLCRKIECNAVISKYRPKIAHPSHSGRVSRVISNLDC